jgi:hypothetical protein
MKCRPGAEKLLAAELEHARRNTDAAGGNIRLMKLQVSVSAYTRALMFSILLRSSSCVRKKVPGLAGNIVVVEQARPAAAHDVASY